jgi:hypothetical protein
MSGAAVKSVQAGVSFFSLYSTLVYTGLRAQGKPTEYSERTRFLTFIFGFPGTLIPYFVVKEGSCEVFGIDLPTKQKKISKPDASVDDIVASWKNDPK